MDLSFSKGTGWINGFFENSYDAVLVLDAHSHVIQDANQRALALFGLDRSILLNSSFDQYCSDDSKAYHRRLLLKSAQGEPVLGELRLLMPRSVFLDVEVAYSATFGYPKGFVVLSVRDLSERRRADRERAQIATRRHESQRLESLNVLVGGVAHDFNNILMSILGYSIIGKDRCGSDPQVSRYFSQIELATMKAGDLCRKMLAFAGRAELQSQRGDLSSFLLQHESEFRGLVASQAELILHFQTGLPEVRFDSGRLMQVVKSLLSNALESLARSAKRVSIFSFLSPLDDVRRLDGFLTPEPPQTDCIVIEVTDSGSGIPPDRLLRVFEPFFSTKFIGRGLGLSEALGVMRAHGGAIQVLSTLGQGSSFRLYFPVSETVLNPPSPKVSMPPFLSSGMQRSLALVVDDEEHNRVLIEVMLKDCGYSVRLASNGTEALQAIDAHGSRITLILLDLSMPELAGHELLAKIRMSKHKDMKIIVMSGYSKEEVYERCYPFRPDGYLPKPFNGKDLMASIG